MEKSILIISRNIHITNSPRSIRWLRFIEYLEKEYKVTILSKYRIPEEAINKFSSRVINYAAKNCELNKDDNVTSSNQIYNPKSKPKLYYKIRNFIKRIYYTLVFPDKYGGWPFEMLYKIIFNGELRSEKFDIIICPSPTPSNLLAGLLAKKIYKSKLIFDIGDPWAYSPNSIVFKWRGKLDRFVEKALLKQSDYIIVNTNELQKLYIDKFDIEKSKIKCIYSGANKGSEVKKAGLNHHDNKFKIVYTGQFHDKIREPYNFFKAVADLDRDMNLDIKIAGNIYPWFIDYYKKLNSKLSIEFLGPLEHEKVVVMQNEADLLLFFSNKSEYQLPSKIFEYLSTNKPILVITYDIYNDFLLNKFSGEQGLFVVENETTKIEQKLKELYQSFGKGKLSKSYQRRDYSWNNRYSGLKKVLNEI